MHTFWQQPQSRRQMLAQLAVISSSAGGSSWAQTSASSPSAWPLWDSFARQFLREDGRILANDAGQTHSEAQSYGLMFALIANDRSRFERILRWTEDNLCGGDLTARLPAWLWGQNDAKRWTVLDDNAASDADIWIAYALAEAGRLWDVRPYRALAGVLARRIVAEETADLPGLGLTLLPGPQGFVVEADKRWRLNPSYLPLQALRLLEHATQDSAWGQLYTSSQRVLQGSAPRGFAPDWVVYAQDGGFLPDQTGELQAQGAYNAIRVYLWLGMLAPNDSARAALLKAYQPMVRLVATLGYPPETVDSITGVVNGAAGGGFSAAFLPFLQAAGAKDAVAAQQHYLQKHAPAADAYYGRCLQLFGQGWMEGAYRFNAQGQLQLPWHKSA